MFMATGLLAPVFLALCTATALIMVSHLGFRVAANMLIMHAGVAAVLLISAVFYSLRVTPADLRQTLARAAPFASVGWAQRKKCEATMSRPWIRSNQLQPPR